MSGVVLAIPDRPENAPRVLAAAMRLAEVTNSSLINVLVIRVPPATTILQTEEILSRRDALRINAEEQARADAIRRACDNWAARAPGSAAIVEWFDFEGLPDQLVGEWGQRADYIILPRLAEHPREAERQAIRAALFDTGRPVLLVPPGSSPMEFGRRIAIAWRPDERTVKAVLSALRWAERSDEVHVLAGARDMAASPRLPEILVEHGVKAMLHLLRVGGERAFGEELLETAHRLGADMLVMGAFVHHPVRNMVLGGVTRYMLTHTDLPVLLRH